jgi:hypothetical protein
LVCFGEKIWIKIKKIVGERSKRERSSKRGEKKRVDKGLGSIQGQVSDNGKGRYFEFDVIGRRRWWEVEKWAMVADPENLYGDLTRENRVRIAELLKGVRKH